MLERIRKMLRRHPEPPPPAAGARPEQDRTSGEDGRRTAEVLANEATTPGTPRLKSKNL